MIFVPMLHYLQNKNSFSGNEDGMRYLITPGKRSVPDPDGGEEAKKEEAILTVDLWPEPWTLDKTDPALRRREIFPMTEEGRTAVAQYLNDAYNAEPERWSAYPSILDCEPWTPPAPEPDAEMQGYKRIFRLFAAKFSFHSQQKAASPGGHRPAWAF